MNIVKTPDYEDHYICSICQEKFLENDHILLIKHIKNGEIKREKLDDARKRKHIFHKSCLSQYLNLSTSDHDPICPLDRDKIHSLMIIHYNDIVRLNLLHFASNYYQLLNSSNTNVSFIDPVNLNRKDANGKTLLYCACQQGQFKIVKQLINLGANPIIGDDQGFTPLMIAVSQNDLRLVRYLINIPPVSKDINRVDHKGKTVLDYVLEYGHLRCLEELLTVDNIEDKVLINILYTIPHHKESLKVRKLIVRYLNRINPQWKMSTLSATIYHSNQKNVSIQIPRDKYFSVDADTNPNLFKIMYQSSPDDSQETHISSCSQCLTCSDKELKELSSFDQINPELIYNSHST
jgi:ankyrin repeat protein